MTTENNLDVGNENQQPQSPSGQPGQASGEASDNKEGQQAPSYESYQKLLAEKKATQAKLREAENILAEQEKLKRQQEEESLKAKQDFQKLAELKEQEAEQYKSRLQSIEDERTEARKLSAFLDTVQGDVDKKYWGLIDTDKIIINPETQEVDRLSVEKLAGEFRESYPETILGRNVTSNIPNRAPTGEQGLTREEWLKLPANQMAKRLKDVIK